MLLKRLASSIGGKDEQPNIDLSIELVASKGKNKINELVKGLFHEDSKIANDCIKVLYEIGEREPELISDHDLIFIDLLKSRSNRLVWGSMTALSLRKTWTASKKEVRKICTNRNIMS